MRCLTFSLFLRIELFDRKKIHNFQTIKKFFRNILEYIKIDKKNAERVILKLKINEYFFAPFETLLSFCELGLSWFFMQNYFTFFLMNVHSFIKITGFFLKLVNGREEADLTFRDWDYEKRNVTLELNIASRRERALYFFRELEMHFQFLVCGCAQCSKNTKNNVITF